MNKNYRQKIIAFFTFLGGIYFFLEFILPEKIYSILGFEVSTEGFKFGYYHDEISKSFQIIGTMALGLGIINILQVHGANILKTKRGWINSLALILGLFIVVAVEGVDFRNAEGKFATQQNIRQFETYVEQLDKQQADLKIDALQSALEKTKVRAEASEGYLSVNDRADGSQFVGDISKALEQSEQLKQLMLDSPETEEAIAPAKVLLIAQLKRISEQSQEITTANYEATTAYKASDFFFEAFFTALGAAMFSLLAFYIANAAYRSFRIKSLEASVMMLAALIVMLGQIPFGPLYVHEDLPAVRVWLLKIISTPAFRAIYFGSAIAGLAMAVRMWLSLERSPLTSDEDEA